MKTVIEMAREAGMTGLEDGGLLDNFLAFAELVRADERNRTWTQEHWTEYEHSIAAAEREACAKVCDIHARGWEINPGENPQAGFIAASNCATTIRNRSNT